MRVVPWGQFVKTPRGGSTQSSNGRLLGRILRLNGCRISTSLWHSSTLLYSFTVHNSKMTKRGLLGTTLLGTSQLVSEAGGGGRLSSSPRNRAGRDNTTEYPQILPQNPTNRFQFWRDFECSMVKYWKTELHRELSCISAAVARNCILRSLPTEHQLQILAERYGWNVDEERRFRDYQFTSPECMSLGWYYFCFCCSEQLMPIFENFSIGPLKTLGFADVSRRIAAYCPYEALLYPLPILSQAIA